MNSSEFPIPERSGLLGVSTLYEAEKSSVDIVFVHGLNGDSIKTWTADGICWPYDILPKDMPNTRIMTWGYSSPILYGGRLQSGGDLRDHVRGLLADMMSVRRSTPDRPLIFVCHSTGGIIVKQLLLDSYADALGPSQGSILKATIGLVFMGTPQVSKANPLFKLIKMHSNSFVDMLNDPKLLTEQSQAFQIVCKDIPIVCCYETTKTTVARQAFMVVPEENAVLKGANVIPIPLDKTHAGLSKFSGPQDPAYVRVSSQLLSFLDAYKIPRPRRSTKHARERKGAKQDDKQSRTELQQLCSILENVKLKPDLKATVHYQRLRSELGYLKEIVGSLNRANGAADGSDQVAMSVLRVISDFTGPHQHFAGALKMLESGDTERQGSEKLYEEMATAISRNLTTVNTLLLLSTKPGGSLVWNQPQQRFSHVTRTNRNYHFDALTMCARAGGPEILPVGASKQTSESNMSDWFIDLRQCQNIVSVRKGNDYAPVKIAVLDTGLDPEMRSRIVEYIDFTDPLRNRIPADEAGHGTFVTDLVLQIAPNAHVFAARVMESGDENEDGTLAVEDAIRHALDDWDVDIVTMSFGWSGYKPENVISAIDLCAKRPILLFAAACNSGARGTPTIAYPASHFGSVFCINSTDGLGDPSKFTPPPRHNADNFSTLGEDVVAAWPRHLVEDGRTPSGELPKVVLSGTSMATPIVAGIAALVIEFWRQYEELFEEEAATVETHGGMHAILKFMSNDDRRCGYDWIKPWELFRQGRKPEHIAVLISYALSKRMK